MSDTTVIVAKATLSQAIEIALIGKRLWEELPYKDYAEYDRDSVLATCVNLMDNGVLIAATSGGTIVGYAGAALAPVFFNMAHTALAEIFWWVDPEWRSKGVGADILTFMEDMAAEKKAKFVSTNLHEEAATGVAGKAVIKAGYSAVERTYLKEVTWEHSAQ